MAIARGPPCGDVKVVAPRLARQELVKLKLDGRSTSGSQKADQLTLLIIAKAALDE